MIAWIALGAATLVAILAILWPAIRGVRTPPPRAEHDAALYRAQLTELDRDRAEGRLSDSEHRDAVLEVQRRLLAAVPGPTDPPPTPRTPALARWVWKLRRSGAIQPEEAARGLVFLATEAAIQGSAEVYWRHGTPRRAAPEALDRQAAGRLWRLSAQMCGV